MKNRKISFSLLTNLGIFEDYTFKKYYDYFNQHQGFSYTREDVITRGYHLIPSVKYHIIGLKHKQEAGIFAGGCIDVNQYFKKSSLFDSRTKNTEYSRLNTSRMGLGITLGAQYMAYTRLYLDINISFFV
ncbi:MAG: hypothetical protein ABFS05_05550, partial [Bacteroidota bacterium]